MRKGKGDIKFNQKFDNFVWMCLAVFVRTLMKFTPYFG